MSRRPSAGSSNASSLSNRLRLIAAIFLVFAWLVDAQQQQHQEPIVSKPTPDYTVSPDVTTVSPVSKTRVLEATTVARQVHPVQVVREDYDYGKHNIEVAVGGPSTAEPTRQEKIDVQAILNYYKDAPPTLHLTSSNPLFQALLGQALPLLDPIDPRLTIEAPPEEQEDSSEVVKEMGEKFDNTVPVIGPAESVINQVRQLPAAAGTSVATWLADPITLAVLIMFLTYWLNKKKMSIYHTVIRNPWFKKIIEFFAKQVVEAETIEREDIAQAQEAAPAPVEGELPVENAAEVVEETPIPRLASLDGVNDTPPESGGASPISEESGELETIDENRAAAAPQLPPTPPASSSTPRAPGPGSTNAEGNRKRGKRGGKKKKKAQPEGESQTSDVAVQGPKTVEDAVRDAQRFGEPKALVPDVETVHTAPTDVSQPIVRINNLEVNTDKMIGNGSNGTIVFEGKLGGRVVAVKRMLIQFFEIASHETRLLEESDIHPNVVRYYVQQESQGFLYIALEMCQASLADVIERPLKHHQLAQRGEKNTPDILYQITNGLRHLHNLRIVHRDLKPQNILVSTTADGNPRMLVSDFGLCKKLDGEQSSFRATTAHAAGTSGWRAPELLLDDDARHDNPAGLHREPSSHMSDNGSGPLVSTDLLPTRRATRAIDIFSLGLVFFYVLTRGSHPYDCGDRYMREVNIRKDQYSLAQLDSLGDDSFEAKDLITAMLQHDPKKRPTAAEVMAHPFFWYRERRLEFLCDVSDYFEKEKRDPPSPALVVLEKYAPKVTRGDFLKPLGKDFLDSLGKQRKYTGNRMLDLLRALRNKKYHYEDMSESLKKQVGRLPEGYLSYWTSRFPNLLICCWEVVREVGWDGTDRFRKYYTPLPPHMSSQTV